MAGSEHGCKGMQPRHPCLFPLASKRNTFRHCSLGSDFTRGFSVPDVNASQEDQRGFLQMDVYLGKQVGEQRAAGVSPHLQCAGLPPEHKVLSLH